MTENKFSGWIASLSNGETVFEHAVEPGEFSAWQGLLRRLKAENLRITQMRLQRNGTTIVGFGGAGGFVHAYEQTKFVQSGNQITVQGIGSIIGNVVFMTWMNDSGHVFQDVRNLSELRVHSTADWQS